MMLLSMLVYHSMFALLCVLAPASGAALAVAATVILELVSPCMCMGYTHKRSSVRRRADVEWCFVGSSCLGLYLCAILRAVMSQRELDPFQASERPSPIMVAFNTGIILSQCQNIIHALLHVNWKDVHHLGRLLTSSCHFLRWVFRFSLISHKHYEEHHVNMNTATEEDTSSLDTHLYQFLWDTVPWDCCGLVSSMLTFGTMHFRTLAYGSQGGHLQLSVIHYLNSYVLATCLSNVLGRAGAYVLHYGFRHKHTEKRRKNGIPQFRMSSNSSNFMSVVLTFSLACHSDHHKFPSRPPHLLQSLASSCKQITLLNGGFLAVVLACFVRPVGMRDMMKSEHSREMLRLDIEVAV